MNFKKIMAGTLASVVAVSSLTVAASAKNYAPAKDDEAEKALYQACCSADNQNWMVLLHKDADPEKGEEEIDCGIDPTTLASFTIYVDIVKNPEPKLGVLDLDKFQIAFDDYCSGDHASNFDFNFAGSFLYTANGRDFGTDAENPLFAKHNWPSNEFYGIPARGDTIEGRPLNQVVEGLPDGIETNTGAASYDKKLAMDFVDDLKYSISYTPSEDERWPAQGEGTTAGLYRVGLQLWDNTTAFLMKPSLLVCKDASGEIVIAYDGYGNVVDNAEATRLSKEMDELRDKAAAEGHAAPAEDPEDTTAQEESPANTEAANDAAVTTAAPASSSTSSGPNVGLIIGIVAAVVVVAVVVVIVIKKKNS